MAKRHTELSTDVVMNFRINPKMKGEIDKLADSEGISSAEWIRRTIQLRLDRADEEVGADITDDELEQKIRKVFSEIMAEREGKQKKLS